ncbi:MAG: hypothetical protein ACTII7_07670 [Galactobacter sp.]
MIVLAAGLVLLATLLGMLLLDLDAWVNRRDRNRDREHRDGGDDPWAS